MAAIGIDGVHRVIGFFCDLCGQECEGEREELNALRCTYAACDGASSVYHQDCIEKYLRRIGLERNRKTGYPCPRGSGKHSKFSGAFCPGRVIKSHPIHIRNEQAKKRQKSKPADPVPAPPRLVKGKAKAKAAEAQVKEKSQVAAPVPKKGWTAAPAQPKDKPKAAAPQVKALPGPSVVPQPRQQSASKPMLASKAQDALKAAVPMDRDQVKDAVYKAKLEIGLRATPPVKVPKAAVAHADPDRQSLREDESTRSSRPVRNIAGAQPVVSAWSRMAVAQPRLVHTSSLTHVTSKADAFHPDLPSTPRQESSSSQREQLQHRVKTAGKQKDTQAASVCKVEGVQAAASPITPNAIKAFQPEQLSASQADFDESLDSPDDSQGLLTEACQQSHTDGQSICSDEASDALFAMDQSTDSDLDKPTIAHAVASNSGFETGYSRLSIDSISLPLSEGAQEVLSSNSPGSDSNIDFQSMVASEHLNQQFLQAIAWQKACTHAAKYQQLGYSRVQGIAAVNKWGDDIQAALAWLLQDNEDVLGTLHWVVPSLDISGEVQYLKSCQRTFCVSKEVLQQIVIGAQGSLPVAVSMLQQWAEQSHPKEHACCKELWLHSGLSLDKPQQMISKAVTPMYYGLHSDPYVTDFDKSEAPFLAWHQQVQLAEACER